MREETYLKVMRLLQENPDLTQRELAEQLGVSVGSVNYCLRALMEKGWVKMKNFVHSKNKFGYVYVLTPTGIAERTKLTSNFLARKVIEFEILKHEIEMLRVEVDNGELSDMKANKT
ncbi:MAG: MarR family EPS-associated transcriptional regulator [Polaromonas sp. 17-63-33]|jgi:EPS-associated MarR family transcriptional regulator|nr:MAG: MarR family EPS-associated transcriptional regulator [Polaromonas sp. 24-63-21]OZA47475.1 MAG: MarR family EPS-associated transcriptional regulator [Polaromonas sp. 17-63-33]